jgi:hypothetical protein
MLLVKTMFDLADDKSNKHRLCETAQPVKQSSFLNDAVRTSPYPSFGKYDSAGV